MEIKKAADERGWFDNYLVLYFTTKGIESAELTKEEVRQKKDPILFGVIRNSRKLYFVADWTDEYCNLTLDKMLKVLKKEVLTVNNEDVRSYIDKIAQK